ncbi:unnamed protein product [Owenia fusiformis]|uniref:COP9 signalosome complex subunit 8 n=1 Tax=Owenia fusiformis TaxID=6347 RepID=A0A8J1XSM8_OWEFU|nr:unnamed protein product [Owenia fusiformis]
MVVPTMSGDVAHFTGLAKQLETQELDSPGGVATPQIYSQLLAIYLVQNDISNAKLLWKRIPLSVKTSNPDLGQVWSVGQKMWSRDYSAVYEALQKDWPDYLKAVMAALLESTRQRAFTLVSQAYSSINADDFSAFMGMPVAEAVTAATNRGWQADPQTRLISPKKEEKPAAVAIPNDQQMARFTDYVSFLEN